MLYLNRHKLLLAAALGALLLAFDLALCEPKPFAAYKWVDIFGEGGTALIIALWTVLILASRPAGRVTNLLFFGLLSLYAAFFQDFSDEVLRMPEALGPVQDVIESGLMLLGMGVLTVGIYQLHREQLVIIEQLRRRERLFRAHEHVDQITRLGDAEYLRRQLDIELARRVDEAPPPAILIVDIDGFNRINREHGAADGDRMLRDLGELLLMNLRPQDLLCRYAGDRFVVLLPGADADTIREIAAQLSEAVRHFAFRSGGGRVTVRQSISIGGAVAGDDGCEGLLRRATEALERAKRDQPGGLLLAA